MITRIWLRLVAAPLIAMVFALSATAGVETIEIGEPFVARSLSGTVNDPGGNGFAGARVEECTKGWNKVETAVATDASGHFAFPAATRNGMHYLKISASGMHTTLIRVKVKKSASQDVKVEIQVAT
jgi:hypothetical protein